MWMNVCRNLNIGVLTHTLNTYIRFLVFQMKRTEDPFLDFPYLFVKLIIFQMLEDMKGLLQAAEEKRQASIAELSAKHQKVNLHADA